MVNNAHLHIRGGFYFFKDICSCKKNRKSLVFSSFSNNAFLFCIATIAQYGGTRFVVLNALYSKRNKYLSF